MRRWLGRLLGLVPTDRVDRSICQRYGRRRAVARTTVGASARCSPGSTRASLATRPPTRSLAPHTSRPLIPCQAWSTDVGKDGRLMRNAAAGVDLPRLEPKPRRYLRHGASCTFW